MTILYHTDDKQLIDQTVLTDMQQNTSVQEVGHKRCRTKLMEFSK